MQLTDCLFGTKLYRFKSNAIKQWLVDRVHGNKDVESGSATEADIIRILGTDGTALFPCKYCLKKLLRYDIDVVTKKVQDSLFLCKTCDIEEVYAAMNLSAILFNDVYIIRKHNALSLNNKKFRILKIRPYSYKTPYNGWDCYYCHIHHTTVMTVEMIDKINYPNWYTGTKDILENCEWCECIYEPYRDE